MKVSTVLSAFMVASLASAAAVPVAEHGNQLNPEIRDVDKNHPPPPPPSATNKPHPPHTKRDEGEHPPPPPPTDKPHPPHTKRDEGDHPPPPPTGKPHPHPPA